MKEIVQGGDGVLVETSEVWYHLRRAIMQPTDKLARMSSWFPSGRFIEDYWLHPSFKALHGQHILGFTLNPEHTPSMMYLMTV
jgi:hypothetical protein